MKSAREWKRSSFSKLSQLVPDSFWRVVDKLHHPTAAA